MPFESFSGPASSGCDASCSCELVWEGANDFSAVAPNGAVLRLGSDWTPPALLSLAIASDLMHTFLRLANERGLAILGYVSSGHVANPADPLPAPSVSQCVVVANDADVVVAEDLCSEAVRQSSIARTLGSRLDVESKVAVIDTPPIAT